MVYVSVTCWDAAGDPQRSGVVGHGRRTAPDGSRGCARRSLRRRVAVVSAPVLLAAALAACSSASAANAPVTLNYWSFPDNSGAIQQAVDTCSAASGGKYTIVYNKLPTDADTSAPATGAPPGRARQLDGHPRAGRDVGGGDRAGGLDPAVDGRGQGGRREGHAADDAADRDVARPAVRGPVQHQHPAAVVPLRPGAHPADHLGADDRRCRAAGQGGQAALHRDPGRPVRGRHGLVQLAGRQRGRQRPERQQHRAVARRPRP